MQYTYSVNLVKKIILVKVKGNLVPAKAALLGRKIRSKAKELNCKIVFDLTDTQNYILIGEALFWISNHYDIIDSDLKFIPTAYIINDKDESFYTFVETVFSSKGLLAKSFKEEQAAIDWVTKYQSTQILCNV